MKALRTAVMLFAVALIAALPGQIVLAQGATVEVNNGAAIALSAGQSIAASGTSGVPVTVKGLSLPAGNGLAAFTFDLTWDPSVIRVDSIIKNIGASERGWNMIAGAPNNATGTVTAAGFRTNYDSADVTLLYVGITAIGNAGDAAMLNVSVNTLSDRNSAPIPATPLGAGVKIGGAAVASGGTGVNLATPELAGSVQLDQYGTVRIAAVLTSSDTAVSLVLSQGTVITDADGVAVTAISGSVVTAAPAAPAGKTLLLAYDFGPDGTRFSLPITLTIKYDPAVANESDLVIAWWDGSKWVNLASTVDANAKTVSARIEHFTQFALLSGNSSPALAPTPPPASVAPSSPAPPAQTPSTTSPPAAGAPSPVVSSPTSPTTPEAPEPVISSPVPPQTGRGANWLLVSGIPIALIVIGVVVFLLVRKQRHA